MRHVDQKERAHRIGDFAETLKVDDARVSAAAGDHHFRFVLFGQARELVVIDALVVAADAVRNNVVGFAGEIQRMAVREMATVSEIHAEDCVARLEHGRVCGLIGLRSGVRLDVGVFGPE